MLCRLTAKDATLARWHVYGAPPLAEHYTCMAVAKCATVTCGASVVVPHLHGCANFSTVTVDGASSIAAKQRVMDAPSADDAGVAGSWLQRMAVPKFGTVTPQPCQGEREGIIIFYFAFFALFAVQMNLARMVIKSRT